jgi:hypothetical protein
MHIDLNQSIRRPGILLTVAGDCQPATDNLLVFNGGLLPSGWARRSLIVLNE